MSEAPNGLIHQTYDPWNEDWKSKSPEHWTIQDWGCFEFQAMCHYHDKLMEGDDAN